MPDRSAYRSKISIIARAAVWKFFRMRLRISAATAHGARQRKVVGCSGNGFAMTRLLLLDACLIILCSADWSIVRMRLRISAAAAHGCGGESFYDFAHLASAALMRKRMRKARQSGNLE